MATVAESSLVGTIKVQGASKSDCRMNPGLRLLTALIAKKKLFHAALLNNGRFGTLSFRLALSSCYLANQSETWLKKLASAC
ncbi:hypothetical protein [Rhizobium azibense]|uniref:hypothetical protein n=1 Tax=Rhizobium azibense TaxID=1136135 RepID=UPI00104815F9|nr:hypothetical protein [Rhizobium azibense]